MTAPETAGQAAAPGQAEREAFRNRLIRAAGEIKNCRSVTALCGPCETQIGDVLAAADAYAQAAIAAAAPAPAGEVTSETVARAAYHVMWAASGVDVRWEDLDPQDRRVWARIALAAIDAWSGQPQAAPELAAAMAERDGLKELLRRYERITTAYSRGMYMARIDCIRGDVKAAIECLSEGLDGYDGTEWNGTETGAEWWERTKAEEGL